MSINIPRQLASNLLMNKYDVVDFLPLVDNSKGSIRAYEQNFYNTCKKLPVAYDFICNVISKIHSIERDGIYKAMDFIEDYAPDYYRISVTKETLDNYLSYVDGFTLRQSITRQLFSELDKSMIKLNRIDRENHVYLGRPFIFEEIGKETGLFSLLLLKDLFEPLVTQEYNKKNSDGFITIPRYLFTKLTLKEDKRTFTSEGETMKLTNNNGLYRLNIFGALHLSSNNKGKSISVDRQSFLESVLPEYTQKDRETKKLYLRQSPHITHKTIMMSIKNSEKNISYKENRLVSNLYFGGNEDKIKIYFSK